MNRFLAVAAPESYANRELPVVDVEEPDFLTRTRASYDAIAVQYEERARDELGRRPLERGLLDHFAGLVAADGGAVLEVGCGPGRISAYLAGRGLDICGIDLSPAMIAVARERHPGIPFAEGTMTNLRLEASSLAGIVAWYSIIHVPAVELPGIFGSFHRALRPGGHLILAFQVGDEVRHLTESAGHQVSLDFHRLCPDEVVRSLLDTGFEERARLVKAADPDEKTPQAVLLVRKPTH